MLIGVQHIFYPSVLYNYQWSFIQEYSWFSITLVSVGSVCGLLGNTVGAIIGWKILPKNWFLEASIVRAVTCLTLFLFLYKNLMGGFFSTDYFLIGFLILCCTSEGFFSVLSFLYGTDESIGDRKTAGMIMTFCSSLGLSISTTISEIFFKWSAVKHKVFLPMDNFLWYMTYVTYLT